MALCKYRLWHYALCYLLAHWLNHSHYHVFRSHINEVKLARYLRSLEQGYPDSNPYHCRAHGADVVRSLYCLLTQGGVLRTIWPDAEESMLLTAIFSAAIHDFEHKGVNVSLIP